MSEDTVYFLKGDEENGYRSFLEILVPEGRTNVIIFQPILQIE